MAGAVFRDLVEHWGDTDSSCVRLYGVWSPCVGWARESGLGNFYMSGGRRSLRRCDPVDCVTLRRAEMYIFPLEVEDGLMFLPP